MQLPEVVAVLEALANGTDPSTGEALPERSPYNSTHVIRALFTAAQELRRPSAPSAGTKPAKAGQFWPATEDEQLRQEFAAQLPIPEIARRHQRTRVAILARLMRLGLLRPYRAKPPPTAIAGAVPSRDSSKDRARAGRAWSAEEDAQLLQGFDGGVPVEQLAHQLQRGVHAVGVRLYKLGRLSGNLAGAMPSQQVLRPTGPDTVMNDGRSEGGIPDGTGA